MCNSEDESVMIEKILHAITGSMSTQNDKVENLKGIVAGLDVELNAISKTLGKAPHSRPRSDAQNGAMRHKLERVVSALSVLTKENDGVKEQLHEKEDDVKEIQKMIGLVEAQSDKLVHINDEIQNYETEIKGMRTDLMAEPISTSAPETETARRSRDGDVTQIRAKYNLQGSLSLSPPSTLRIAEQRTASKLSDAFDMRAVLDSIKTKYDEICEERISTVDKTQQLRLAFDSMTKAREDDAAQHSHELRSLNAEISKAKQRIVDSNAEISRLRTEQQSSESRAKSENERLRAEVSRLRNELTQQSRSKTEMERSMQRQSDEFGRYQASKEHLIARVNAQLAELQREMGAVQTQRLEMQRMVDAKDRELQSSLADREQTVNTFRSDKVELMAELKNGQRAQNLLTQQLEAFKRETAAQQKQIARLSEQNQQMSRSGQASQYQFHHSKSNYVVDQFEAANVGENQQRSDGVLLMNNVKDLKSQSAIVQSKINEMRSRTQQMQIGLKHNNVQEMRIGERAQRTSRRSSILNLRDEIQRIQNMNLHI